MAADDASTPVADDARRFRILGVELTDVPRDRAVELLIEAIERHDGRTRAVYFANAHTLNLAASDAEYRAVLNAGDYVFGDGTGVRWAARLHGIRVHDNLCGTDLVPALWRATARRGYRYFLLGADEAANLRAAQYAAAALEGWVQAGRHHGYVADADLSREVVLQINESGANVLLVGMGNPLQEQWIHAHRDQLRVPLALGVGGLLRYWSGDLRRAPRWLRRLGAEWLGILVQQPHKARRYLLGNPLFLWRIGREALARRRSGACRSGAIGKPRWYAKKLARRAVSLSAALPPRAEPADRANRPALVRALTYHRCDQRPYDPFCVAPSDFDAQMRYLAESGLAISLDDLEAMLAGRAAPRGGVLVTIDDGFRSVLDHMLPSLRRWAIPAVAFVSPGLIAESAETNALPSSPDEPSAARMARSSPAGSAESPEPYLTWGELERLADAGVTIGAHGWSHRSLGRLSPDAAREEAVRSREALEARLGRPVRAMAYPFGTRTDYSAATRAILAASGYTIAFTSQHGAIRPGCDPLQLPRVKIEGGEPVAMFRRICRGGLDAWRWVDRALWPLQRAGR